MRPVKFASVLLVNAFDSAPVKSLAVPKRTSYIVSPAGLRPFVQFTVSEVKYTAVHVLAAVTGTEANVAVVTLALHALVLPLKIDDTRE